MPKPRIHLTPGPVRSTVGHLRGWMIDRDQQEERPLESMSLGCCDMPAELTERDARLDLRFDEQCPPGITEDASIRKASALYFVSWLELARELLLCYPKLTIGRNVLRSSPPEKRSEQSAVSI